MSTELERLPSLGSLIQHARKALDGAKSYTQVLEARAEADTVYTAARLTARLSKVKDAHNAVQEKCRVLMGDAIQLEVLCQIKLADEIDLAQANGQLRTQGDNSRDNEKARNPTGKAGLPDIGLTGDAVHRARIVRDASLARPGFVRELIEEKLRNAQAPTRRQVQQAAKEISGKRRPLKAPRRTMKAPANGGTEAELPTVAIGDVAAILALADRVRSRFGEGSADVRALCSTVERLCAVHVRGARGSAAGVVGAGVEATAA
jgi:hypothetical protein